MNDPDETEVDNSKQGEAYATGTNDSFENNDLSAYIDQTRNRALMITQLARKQV